MRVERLSGPDNRPGPLRSAHAAHTTLPSPSPQPRAQDEVKGGQRRARPPAARHSPPEPARPGDRPLRPRRVVLGPRLQGALRLFPPSSRPRPSSPNRGPFVERAREIFFTRANSQVFPPSQPSVPEPSARDRPLAFLTTLGLEGTLPEKSRARWRLQTPGEKRQTVREVQVQKVPPFPQHHHPALERQGRRERERGGESPVLEDHGTWDP